MTENSLRMNLLSLIALPKCLSNDLVLKTWLQTLDMTLCGILKLGRPPIVFYLPHLYQLLASFELFLMIPLNHDKCVRNTVRSHIHFKQHYRTITSEFQHPYISHHIANLRYFRGYHVRGSANLCSIIRK